MGADVLASCVGVWTWERFAREVVLVFLAACAPDDGVAEVADDHLAALEAQVLADGGLVGEKHVAVHAVEPPFLLEHGGEEAVEALLRGGVVLRLRLLQVALVEPPAHAGVAAGAWRPLRRADVAEAGVAQGGAAPGGQSGRSRWKGTRRSAQCPCQGRQRSLPWHASQATHRPRR